MDLINWSLNAIDTIFSTRKSGSGEPDCPAGTYAAGYTMDAWERWRVVCLAALSLEDIEDIYLFGTLITGILLMGLGFALLYQKFKRTESAILDPKKLPAMIDAVGRAVGAQTVAWEKFAANASTQTMTLHNMDKTLEKHTANFETIWNKLTAIQSILDQLGDQNGHRKL